MVRVAINGLGRIGRAALKIIVEHPEMELVAINDLVSPDNLAYLLRYDTVYGRYHQPIKSDESSLTLGETSYKVFSEKDPAQLPWDDLGIDIVFECTGVFRRSEGLEKHLQAGAKHVVLSAPPKSDGITTVVYGINQQSADAAKTVSCASCTTNCIAPVVEVMQRRVGIKKAIMTTIHAYTSSQAIVDSPSSKYRRGRAAAANFVPTSTGAAIATTEVLPELKGKFNGVAVRGPVPVGSIADIVFVCDRPVEAEALNQIFREEAETEQYQGVLGVSEDPIVSSDIIQDSRASIVDLTMTQVVDGDLVKVMSWYDNEWGYANQMVRQGLRLAQQL
ncbi:MAG: type I glyceraldehyde-3-phosphate dehydrogenase [Leptolyngbyaceae cyanobacterium SM1_1_3]|nr:type I glyceraldehyde-3-phosphate dehydrogenase [Leptolyngbyaceae cyanobacterium SM1_1_3]NJN03434.1 type I glyceraldehyde-3-phosphate dehydrogenase [Leptolyngbyaceae cyanobacterium RM1_1_2]NJO08804.1 type I glyceraldehyde-3-phosphate dehydrogenase [Leptolyngbyaceae cyanobacterium SL_1_1]